ncbi:MAG: hypothetical protein HY709_09995 [Candidatus Latescibacteria bacterium]|nr:hypothetical protein [Candidatus Latescibacterota bacterium]
MKRYYLLWGQFVLFFYFGDSIAQHVKTSVEPTGPGVLMEALEPSLRKWYRPQELYYEFGWEQWQYSNYAKSLYERYVDINLEGFRFYDIYGNYVTRGWRIFSWEQDQPGDLGSRIFKNPRLRSWFNDVVISSASKGQYYTAVTLGEQIRTTLTPLTLSTPTFNGIQWDFMSDKYALTALLSRVNNPGTSRDTDFAPPESHTDFVNFLGFRGTWSLGDFATVGGTYVNGFVGNSLVDWIDNSLKGLLSTGQNAGKVRTITIKISDDSPEDGEAGGMFFTEEVEIDGRRAEISPEIRGGFIREGWREANGRQEIFLVYDFSDFSYFDETGKARDLNWFKKIQFELILANDYTVEVTSNLQLNAEGVQIFLPVARAEGNVKDASNMRVVTFDYGLPTANEIFGFTFDVDNVVGFKLRSEFNLNRRHRRFPNQNPDIAPGDHTLATDTSHGFYATASSASFPWFGYGEIFSIEDSYTTRSYIVDPRGNIFYDDQNRYVFEFIDDNDDQDRFPDWNRNNLNQRAGNDLQLGRGIFPGLDENNDLVSDFNQNQNLQPDYIEPFLRYKVDPPEFLFGMDTNNNTVIDRFENDDLPDYPYKADHQGYNAYLGLEVARDAKLLAGYLSERLLSGDGRSRSAYGLFTFEKSFPRLGDLRLFEHVKVVKDDISDDLLQWEQQPNTLESLTPFNDPVVAPNTLINTTYAQFDYRGIRRLNVTNKVKYETYHQRKTHPRLADDASFLGVINKADYTLTFGEKLIIQPKFKSMLKRQTAFERGKLERRELSELVSLILNYPALNSAKIETGLEYMQFINLIDKPTIPPPDFEDDFREFVYVFQFTNTSAYLGYRLISQIGLRQGVRFFENKTKASALAFVNVFASTE